MMSLVSSDELAKDVTGAEALLERHQVGGSSSVSFLFLHPSMCKAYYRCLYALRGRLVKKKHSR